MTKANPTQPESCRLKLTDLVPYVLQAMFFSPTSKDEDDRFLADLRKNGQRDAIVVVPQKKKNGRRHFVILDGHRRVWAFTVLGRSEIDAIIRWDLVDKDETTIEAEFLGFNLNRRHVHILDQARSVMRLFEIEKKRPRDSLRLSNVESEARDRVGRVLGISGRHLQRLFRVLLTPLPVQRAVRDGRLPMVLGEQVERLDVARQAEIAARIEAGEKPKDVVTPYLDTASVKNNGANRTFFSFSAAMKRGCVRVDACIDNIAPHNIHNDADWLRRTRDLLDRLLAKEDARAASAITSERDRQKPDGTTRMLKSGNRSQSTELASQANVRKSQSSDAT